MIRECMYNGVLNRTGPTTCLIIRCQLSRACVYSKYGLHIVDYTFVAVVSSYDGLHHCPQYVEVFFIEAKHESSKQSYMLGNMKRPYKG
jgi:hypothetical protein